MTGISGHADREGLVRWVSHIAPKPTHVFVVHGEDTVTDSFASLLTTTYGINATAPYTGESWDLLSDQKIREGTREYVKKDYQPREGRMSDVYRKLFDAAQQLLAIVKNTEKVPIKIFAVSQKILKSCADVGINKSLKKP